MKPLLVFRTIGSSLFCMCVSSLHGCLRCVREYTLPLQRIIRQILIYQLQSLHCFESLALITILAQIFE